MFPNLKLQIWRTGLRQNRVAQMLQIDETILSKILNGFREPAPELKIKIASLLQCDPLWLFERQTNVRDLSQKSADDNGASGSDEPSVAAGLDGTS